MSKLFGLAINSEKQEPLITAHCFGDCGKISMGGVIMSQLGPLMVCCEQVCPYLDEETDFVVGESAMTGEPVYLRGLKEPK